MSPAGSEHGALAATMAAFLVQYVRANKLGVVFGAETGFKVAENPDTVPPCVNNLCPLKVMRNQPKP